MLLDSLETFYLSETRLFFKCDPEKQGTRKQGGEGGMMNHEPIAFSLSPNPQGLINKKKRDGSVTN